MAFFIGGAAGAAIAGAVTSAVAAPVIGRLVGGGGSSSSSQPQGQAATAATNAADLQQQIAAEQWQKYNEIYDPLERTVVDEAKNYDSEAAYAQAAGDASATVASQYGKARERFMRQPGLDPSSPAYANNLASLELAQAATDATQQNAARQRIKDTAFSRKTDALSLGKGLPASASATLGAATNSNLALANLGMNQAQQSNQQNGQISSAVGNLVNRVVTPDTMSRFGNWLTGGSGTQASYSMGLSSVVPENVVAANNSADPIGSLADLQGW